MLSRQVARAVASAAVVVALSLGGLAPSAVAADTRTISGVVTLPGGPDPRALDAVVVTVAPAAGGASTQADVSTTGVFAATGLAPGRYTVCAGPRGYTQADGTYTDGPYNVLAACYDTTDRWGTRGTVDVTEGDRTGLTVALPWGLTISGTVALPPGADPEWLRGVEAYSQMTVTGGFVGDKVMVDPASGSYTLDGLYPGEHSVLFGVKPYTDPATGAKVTPALSTSGIPDKVVLTTSSLTGVDVTMNAGSVSGKFSVVVPPEIVGDPLVGQTLTARVGAWTPTAAHTYGWYRDSVLIPGATSDSYTIVEADLHKDLTVRVQGTASGVASVVLTSAPVEVENSFTTLGTPTITGAAQVGSTLTCHPGAWVPTPTAITYQWIRGGLQITGATAATYVTQPADAAKQLVCRVNADNGPYPDIDRFSAPLLLVQEFTSAGSVAIAGEANVGSTLTASVVGTTPGASVTTYQWYRNGVALPSSTSASYAVTSADSLSTLRVTARVGRPGYNAADAVAAQVAVPKLFTSAPTVTISGRLGRGEVLTATVPAWTPAATFTYQWSRNGAAIPGAQQRTYTLTTEDQDSTIAVRVVGSAPTYQPVARTASITTLKFLEPVTPPTISAEDGPALLRAEPGTWSPAATSVSYQWKRDGQPVGGDVWVYWTTEEDFGKVITVTVVASRSGYSPHAVTSAPYTMPLGHFGRPGGSAGPTITGTAVVGATVVAVPVTLVPEPTATAYQWFRGDTAISGATSAEYRLAAADVGAAITVRTTSTRAGYTPLTLGSAASTVARGTFTAAPVPTVSGALRAGSTLTAKPGRWSPTATFRYRWYRGGDAISGATRATYVLTPADRGRRITVKVTGSRPGYTKVTRTSVAELVPKVFSAAPIPTITGTAKAGSTLRAHHGTWSPTPTFTYRWYRSGVLVSGATAATYRLTTADRGRTITVKVTGSRTGFVTLTKTSAGRKVA